MKTLDLGFDIAKQMRSTLLRRNAAAKAAVKTVLPVIKTIHRDALTQLDQAVSISQSDSPSRSPLAPKQAPPVSPPELTREMLIGDWRLVAGDGFNPRYSIDFEDWGWISVIDQHQGRSWTGEWDLGVKLRVRWNRQMYGRDFGDWVETDKPLVDGKTLLLYNCEFFGMDNCSREGVRLIKEEDIE